MWEWVQFWGGPSWDSCVLVWSSSILLLGLGRFVKVKIHVQKHSGPLDTRRKTYGLKSLEISPQNRPVKSLPLQKSLENCGHSILGTSRARGAGVLPLGLSSTPLPRGCLSLLTHPQQRGQPLFCSWCWDALGRPCQGSLHLPAVSMDEPPYLSKLTPPHPNGGFCHAPARYFVKQIATQLVALS